MVSPRLSSIFVVCSNLARSARFYNSLGFVEKKKTKRSQVLAAHGGLEIHLHGELTVQEQRDFGVSQEPGSRGLVQSYEVPDIQDLATRLSQESILFGPQETSWGHKILLLEDPDGHRLELRESSPSRTNVLPG